MSEDWWNSVQGVDNTYASALAASILSLQETYLNKLKESDAAY